MSRFWIAQPDFNPPVAAANVLQRKAIQDETIAPSPDPQAPANSAYAPPNSRDRDFSQIPVHAATPTPLPKAVQSKMERAFNTSFSNVRVYANSPNPAAVEAIAYTQGNAIHFAPGIFQPSSSRGQERLGHELMHVVQQRSGVASTHRLGGLPLNNSPTLEAEADRAGKQAASGAAVFRAGQPVPTMTAAMTHPVVQRLQWQVDTYYGEKYWKQYGKGHSQDSVPPKQKLNKYEVGTIYDDETGEVIMPAQQKEKRKKDAEKRSKESLAVSMKRSGIEKTARRSSRVKEKSQKALSDLMVEGDVGYTHGESQDEGSFDRSATQSKLEKEWDEQYEAEENPHGVSDDIKEGLLTQYTQLKGSDEIKVAKDDLGRTIGVAARLDHNADEIGTKLTPLPGPTGFKLSTDDSGHLVTENLVAAARRLLANSTGNLIAENLVINQVYKVTIEKKVKEALARGITVVYAALVSYPNPPFPEDSPRKMENYRPVKILHMYTLNGEKVVAFTLINSNLNPWNRT